MKCPKCGYEIETQQNRAAKSRWSSMTKTERAAEMSRIRRKGIKRKPKGKARNSCVRLGGPDATNTKSQAEPPLPARNG